MSEHIIITLRSQNGPSYQGGSKNGRHTLKISGRTGMHGKSRVSSAIKYDSFKLDDSGNCTIRKTWLDCI